MSIRSQAALEFQYHQRTAQVQSGTLSPERAFGNMEEWVIQLGQRKALLHPGKKQWMWYDKLHDEWVFADCGVGEAILLSIGSGSGIKKLPQPGEAAGWCVYRLGQELFGPMRVGELLSKLKSQSELKDILIWSPQATDWLSVVFEPTGEISFHDEYGNRILISAKGEVLLPVGTKIEPPVSIAPAQKSVPPPPSIIRKKSNNKLIIPIVVIVILLCFCLSALTAIIYFVAKAAGTLPVWLGGRTWIPLLIM